MKEKEFETIANIIDEALSNPKDTAHHATLRKRTMELCEAFPLYTTMRKEMV